MITIYKEHLKGSHHFSRVFAYVLLSLRNKENFFKKRSLRGDPFFSNWEKSHYVKKRTLSDSRKKKKKKNLVIHFATSQISYFYFHYFVYILLPKLRCLSDCEKRNILDNVYLVDRRNNDENVKGHIYNKIKQGVSNIIFSDHVLAKEEYDYTHTLGLFLENTLFMDILENAKVRKVRRQHAHCFKSITRQRLWSNTQMSRLHSDRSKNHFACRSCLYGTYFWRSRHPSEYNVVTIRKRNANLSAFEEFNEIVQDINNNVQWVNHHSFYKFYQTAYVSFLNHRMSLLQSFLEMVIRRYEGGTAGGEVGQEKRKKKKNLAYIFFERKDYILNARLFPDFVTKKAIYIDFYDAANLYVKYLQLLERVSSFSGCPREGDLAANGDNNLSKKSSDTKRKSLLREIKKDLNLHVWSRDQKESFYSDLVKMKFRKFYN
ncbi:hypothetical protein C922_01651 [Plasmodium inui San Antonio 1]|uniref:Uncharacterized protein n=1 Tax=Plasmodium inui San Antonio 1 TaxID=1237626 RepID=W7AGD1_9APIC|nr:hypothetical protein C922_01651 [Plasmodium inui San Antonio 1]EUD68039.1 hypothetical protein C922_01651 [Plasmodium inui San Antonio 1]